MKQLLRPSEGSDMITPEAFIGKMKTWRETTSTSPSGIHLGHYKALVAKHQYPTNTDKANQIESLQFQMVQLQCNILNLCIAHQSCLHCWKTVASVLLEKDPGSPKSTVYESYTCMKLIIISFLETNGENSFFMLETLKT